VSVFFLDTSALVKRYVTEVGSGTVVQLIAAPDTNIL
jgi:hypothetical protein